MSGGLINGDEFFGMKILFLAEPSPFTGTKSQLGEGAG